LTDPPPNSRETKAVAVIETKRRVSIMRLLLIGAVVAVVLFWGGCSKNEYEPFALPNKRAASFDSQLEAAKTLPVAHERDDAIALVARDAANVGDVHWAKLALQAISEWEIRDDAALAVAVRLSRGGRPEAADEVARSIASSVVRDETLKFISKPK
jgi:hypothetical protein